MCRVLGEYLGTYVCMNERLPLILHAAVNVLQPFDAPLQKRISEPTVRQPDDRYAGNVMNSGCIFCSTVPECCLANGLSLHHSRFLRLLLHELVE